MKHGKELFARQDYPRALLEFLNAASLLPGDAEPPYQLGLTYLATGDVQNAIRSLMKAAALNPKHAGAQLKLAQLMNETHNEKLIGEGMSRLVEAFGSMPDNPDALDALALGEWNLGKPEEAAAHLEESLRRFPTHLASSVALARMKLSARDWAGAEQVLKEAVARAPESSAAVMVLGELHLYLKQAGPGEAELKRALELDPRNGRALTALAYFQASVGRTEEAERTFRQLAALPDKASKPLHALFLYATGKREAAIAELEQLAKADPNDRDARTRLVTAYIQMDRRPQAEATLAAALKRNPQDADALLQRGELRLRSLRLDDAEKDLQDVVHFKRDSATAHFFLGVVSKAKSMDNNARSELQEAIRINPALLGARVALAVSYLGIKQPEAALDVLNQAPSSQKRRIPWVLCRNWALMSLGNYQEAAAGIMLAMSRNRPPEAVYQSAVLHYLQRDYAGARRDIDELLKRDVGGELVAQLMVETYAQQNDLAKGLVRLKELAAAHPASAPMQYLLGQWEMRNGDTASAEKAYEAAKAVDSHLIAADIALAELDLKAGRNGAARQRLRGVIAASPNHIAALLLSARTESAAGDEAAAIARYRAVLKIDQSNLIALNNLAYALVPENPDEALKFAQHAAEMAPENPSVQDTLGWVYYRKGIYSMAVRYLKIAVDKEATPRRQFHLGMSYLKLGDQAAGQKIVREALLKDPNLATTERAW